jgi:hypothetical protein
MSANPAILPNTYVGLELVPFVREIPPLAKESDSHSAKSAESLRRAKAFLTSEGLIISGNKFAIGRVSC